MSTRDDLAGVLADTINKQFKDMKVAYFLDGSDTTPTDIKILFLVFGYYLKHYLYWLHLFYSLV